MIGAGFKGLGKRLVAVAVVSIRNWNFEADGASEEVEVRELLAVTVFLNSTVNALGYSA